MQSLRLVALIALVVAIGVPAPARGDGGGSSRPKAVSPKQADPQYTNAVRTIQASKFAEAIPLLEQVVARDQANADAYNWLAYATRRNGDPAKAIGIYQQALSARSQAPRRPRVHRRGVSRPQRPPQRQAAPGHARLAVLLARARSTRDLKKAIQEYERNGGAPKPSAGR